MVRTTPVFFIPNSVIVTQDEKILVAGTRTLSFKSYVKQDVLDRKSPQWFDPTVSVIYRLSLKGVIDKDFGDNGVVVLNETTSHSFRASVSLVIDKQGRIYLRGASGVPLNEFTSTWEKSEVFSDIEGSTTSTSAYPSDFNSRFLYRFTPEGKPDVTFGSEGVIVVDNKRFPNLNTPPVPFVDADNHPLLATGLSATPPTGASDNKCGTNLLRYTEGGIPDATFGKDKNGASFIEADSSRLLTPQDCQMWVLSLVPSSLGRTTLVGTVVSDGRNYPFLTRFWN